MTTTIQCTYHMASVNCSLIIDPRYGPGKVGLTVTRGNDETEVVVPTADLLAALDATANTDVAKLHFEEVGEQDYRAGSPYRYKIAYEHWRRLAQERKTAADERAEWKARAEKAESTLSRIEDVRHDFYEIRGDWADPEGAAALKAQMERAILGDPPFTLPTEAGAKFEAREKFDGAPFVSFVTLIGHDTPAYMAEGDFDSVYPPGEVMEEFTDHRPIGAES